VIERAVEAIRAGLPVILPTDTVYGLCTTASFAEAVERLYRLKGRPGTQPTALLAGSVEALLEQVPDLPEGIVRSFLPGPYTLVLPNPAQRFPWLNGGRPEAIGVRVPNLRGEAAEVVRQTDVVVATSANLAGGPDPRRLDDVPSELREAAAAEIDGGELPGVASTVIDFTGEEPQLLRAGAGAFEPDSILRRNPGEELAPWP
jgi:L-threonylcarbamoyladenylate synthase